MGELRLTKAVRQVHFDTLLQEAQRLSSPCRCCIRACGARRPTEAGFCGGNPAAPQVRKFFITHGEEPVVTPALMLYAGGCNMRCDYCSNPECFGESSDGSNFPLAALQERAAQAHRDAQIVALQLLGGEPSCWLPGAIQLASRLPPTLPLVWNSNFTFSADAARIIQGFADFYIADFKFGNDACAARLAALADYTRAVRTNLLAVPPDRLLIRHLPLHGHLECCTRPILEFIAEYLPHTPVNFNELLPQPHSACRRLDAAEWQKLEQWIKKSRITRIYSQLQPSSATLSPKNDAGLSLELQIRPDGRVAIQDFSGELWGLFSEDSLFKESTHEERLE